MLNTQEGRVHILGSMTEGRGRRHQSNGIQVAPDISAASRPWRMRVRCLGMRCIPTRTLRYLASYVQNQEGGQDGDDEQAAPAQGAKSHPEKQRSQQIAEGIPGLQEPRDESA